MLGSVWFGATMAIMLIGGLILVAGAAARRRPQSYEFNRDIAIGLSVGAVPMVGFGLHISGGQPEDVPFAMSFLVALGLTVIGRPFLIRAWRLHSGNTTDQ